jgi:ferredoxin
MAACPVEAIYRRPDGLVVIDTEKCTGCKNCVDLCPYGAIFFNEDLNLAQKCTGCAHLLDGDHPINVPRCVDACPTEALKFGEESELKDMIAKAEVLDPVSLGGSKAQSVKPRVYYLNIPRKFVAGTVYDPIQKEVIIGATCTLSNNGNKMTKTTDGFGDFWFEGLDVGIYSLKIEAKGFPTKTFASISTEDDVNLGDIALA